MSLLVTSSIKCEIRHFHVVVVQKWERNVEKSVMHVFCLLNRLFFWCSCCCPRRWIFKSLMWILCWDILGAKISQFTCLMLFVFIEQGLHSLEKSLNIRGSPWKVLEFLFTWKVLKFLSKSLKSPWIFFYFERSDLESVFLCFLLSKTGYDES